MAEPQINVAGEQPKDMPKFMELMDNGFYLVHTEKDGDFLLKDANWGSIESIYGNKGLTNRETSALICRSLVKPELGELDLAEKKGSTVFRLQKAVMYIYDMKDFLSE